MRLGQTKRRVFSRPSKYNPNKDYYHELRYTNMPAIIAEYAFIDGEDYKDIDTQEERLNEAQAILNAILTFYMIEPIESRTDEITHSKIDIESINDKLLELEGLIKANKTAISKLQKSKKPPTFIQRKIKR